MTAITVPATDTAVVTRTPSWRFGLGTAAVAAVAATLVAVALRATGVPLDIAGEEIPILGFAQLTFLCSVFGIALARRMSVSAFVKTTVVLTVLSFVPDVIADTGTASKLGLALTHLVAAAIVIPRLAAAKAD